MWTWSYTSALCQHKGRALICPPPVHVWGQWRRQISRRWHMHNYAWRGLKWTALLQINWQPPSPSFFGFWTTFVWNEPTSNCKTWRSSRWSLAAQSDVLREMQWRKRRSTQGVPQSVMPKHSSAPFRIAEKPETWSPFPWISLKSEAKSSLPAISWKATDSRPWETRKVIGYEVVNTSAANISPSTLCSDPEEAVRPQWKWNCANLYLFFNGPPSKTVKKKTSGTGRRVCGIDNKSFFSFCAQGWSAWKE